MTNAKRKFITIIAALALLLPAIASVYAAFALPTPTTYYICYENDDYRVRAVNALEATGETYTIDTYLSRGDRFVISDGGGRMWGDEKGQPITVRESGTNRYAVRFDPDAEDGEFVTLDFYTPSIFGISVDGKKVGDMIYQKARPLSERYYFYLELNGGEVITVTGEDGTTYGESGIDESGVTVTLAGKYRFAFTADEDHLFDSDKYITFDEYPTLYLMCDENDFTENDGYIMERDEDVVAYEQYRAKMSVTEKNAEVNFYVLDKGKGEEYKPSESGTITIKDKGEYYVLYSPNHIYSASGDASYRVSVSRVPEFYDGYYLLGDFNGFVYIAGDEEFDEKYKLVKDDEQTSYDEYKLTFTVDSRLLSENDGKAEFYIGDGESIYRRLNGSNITIDEAGEYELTFSPTHDYGRGLRYRYVRVADETQKRTVKVSSPEQLADLLKDCTSPEYSLGLSVVLTCDLDMSGVDYTPALIFAGTFDGSYRTVKGIKNSGDNDNFLFREVTEDGVICRVTLSVELSSLSRYTAPIGENNGLIEEVTVTGSVDGDGYVGGIAASNTSSGKLQQCVNRASVNGVMNVGGIVGFNAGRLYECKNEGRVNGKTFSSSDSSGMLNVGGIAGYATGNILACTNSADIGTKQGRYFGGIVGLSSGGLFACINGGNISASSYGGGIVGYYGRFDNSSSSGGLGDYLLGGRFEDWLDSYFGSDNTDFEESVDNNVHEIYYCINKGGVTVTSSYVGGIAAHAGAGALNILGCVSLGNAETKASYAGGIVGEFGTGRIDGCLSYGKTTASGSYAGGIVGSATGSISNCNSSAYVYAENFVGGIVGSTAGRLNGCISYAFVDALESPMHLGFIAGQGTVSLCKNNYYLDGDRRIGGIDGVTYGSENDYAAQALTADRLTSMEMLSPYLVGLSDEQWLAGETESRYPIPRVLSEITYPDAYDDKSAFEKAFALIESELKELSDIGSRAVVTVTFYTYDFGSDKYETDAVIRLHKGQGIAESELPEVPEEEGYFTWWSRSDFSSVQSDTEVYMQFDNVRTTIASDDGDKPEILIEGKFHSNTTLTLVYNGEYVAPLFKRDGTETSYGDVYVRYLVPNTDKYIIKLVRGGEIVTAETTVNGEYLCFILPEGWSFAAVDSGKSLTPLWVSLAAVSSAIVVSLAFGIPLIVIHRKKKKSAKAAETEENNN